jgi:glutamyl-tRNA synthetase
LAPSPTGYLHLGHARTFWIAQTRASAAQGTLILRNDDLDRSRVRSELVQAMFEDLHWFGFDWQEGPDVGGPFAPYNQSERLDFYWSLLEKLKAGNSFIPAPVRDRKFFEPFKRRTRVKKNQFIPAPAATSPLRALRAPA